MSIILIAVGAILAWAVEVDAEGFNINTAGYIILVVGVIGLLISLVLWSSVGSWGPWRNREGRVVRDERHY